VYAENEEKKVLLVQREYMIVDWKEEVVKLLVLVSQRYYLKVLLGQMM
jgi:hypothetical protein